jgi:hypothetical protein
MAARNTDTLVEAARSYVALVKATGMKGKKRDDSAIAYFYGVASAAKALGHEDDYNRVSIFAAMVLPARGYGAVESVANA